MAELIAEGKTIVTRAFLQELNDRIAELERKNLNLSRMARGFPPDGFVLVKATEGP